MKKLNENSSFISKSVLDRIEAESVVPKSKKWFFCIDCTFWTLWIVSVLFGAVSFSIIEMVWMHRRYDLFEATHESFADFIIEVLPYIWLVSFLLMVLIAYINLRNTKRGYRYPFYQIVFGGLLLSVFGGTILYLAGLGDLLDKQLGKSMDFYMSQEKMELKMWQDPAHGRLVGVLSDGENADLVIFKDVSGDDWELTVSELDKMDMKELRAGYRVRLLGMPVTEEESKIFHVCGVLPWLFDENFRSRDPESERKSFLERMSGLKNVPVVIEDFVEDDLEIGCSEIDLVKRIGV